MNEAQADEASVGVCRNYAQLGLVGIVIRTSENGNVRIIGPELPGASVAHMLRTAAKCYEDQAPKVTTN